MPRIVINSVDRRQQADGDIAAAFIVLQDLRRPRYQYAAYW